ncbi:hypothetical protein GCM10027277_07850 [Pseudoduganella ginsengisoli]
MRYGQRQPFAGARIDAPQAGARAARRHVERLRNAIRAADALAGRHGAGRKLGRAGNLVAIGAHAHRIGARCRQVNRQRTILAGRHTGARTQHGAVRPHHLERYRR